MKKFYFSFLLAVLLPICSIAANAHELKADTTANNVAKIVQSIVAVDKPDFDVDGIYYNITGDSTVVEVSCTYSFTGAGWQPVSTYSGDVVIPESVTYDGKTYSVTGIRDFAFSYSSGLTSIKLPTSIKTVGMEAFYNCVGLTAVYIDDLAAWLNIDFSISTDLVVIGAPAPVYSTPLYYSKKLYLKQAGTYSLLTDPYIPFSVEKIGNLAFAGSDIKNVIITNNVETISYGAFMDCTSLTSVEIPNSVTTIEDYAFYGCSALKEIHAQGATPPTLPSTAFENVSTAAVTLYVPRDSKNAYKAATGWSVFANVVELAAVASDGIYYTITDSVAKTCAVTFKGNTYDYIADEYKGDIIIPSEVDIEGDKYAVTAIGEHAFRECAGLTSISIPASVTNIGNYAFYKCTGLKSVCIEDGESSITLGENGYDGQFNSCPLENIYIGRNLAYNAHYLSGFSPFAYIATLTSVVIGEKVTSLPTFLLKDCSSLTAITIPEGINSIGDYVFQYCDLREIHIPASLSSIGEYAFTHNNNLEKITVAVGNTTYSSPEGSNVLMQGNNLILGCMGAVIPDFATAIANGAFNGIHGITSITIPENIASIGEYAFEACSDLKEIHCLSINPVSKVGDYAFDGLYEDVTLYVPALGKKVYTIDTTWKQFANIVAVGEIVSDDFAFIVLSEEEETVQLIDYLGNNTIVNIPSSITINGKTYSVTGIGDCAFYGCTGLTSITIPNSVASIGNAAFYNCNGLTNVTIGSGVTGIGGSAFYGCTGLTSITIPNSVTSIENYAFQDCI